MILSTSIVDWKDINRKYQIQKPLKEAHRTKLLRNRNRGVLIKLILDIFRQSLCSPSAVPSCCPVILLPSIFVNLPHLWHAAPRIPSPNAAPGFKGLPIHTDAKVKPLGLNQHNNSIKRPPLGVCGSHAISIHKDYRFCNIIPFSPVSHSSKFDNQTRTKTRSRIVQQYLLSSTDTIRSHRSNAASVYVSQTRSGGRLRGQEATLCAVPHTMPVPFLSQAQTLRSNADVHPMLLILHFCQVSATSALEMKTRGF